MGFWKEYQHDIIVIILTLAISGILAFLFKKGKSIWYFIIEKRKRKIQRKEYEEQIEDEMDKEWTQINRRIDVVILNIETFKKYYSSNLPNSKKRIAYIKEYLDLFNEELTAEQENKLLDIKELVIQMYEELVKSNNASKKEKKIYLDYLERIKDR